MRNPVRHIRSFDDCKTLSDYNQYMRQRRYPTPIPHELEEKKRDECYWRVLKSDSIKYWQYKKKKA